MNNKLKICSDLFVHWDSSYWYAFYVFLVLQGALIVAFTQVYTTTSLNGRLTTLLIISIGGIVLSLIWLLVMNRKMTYTRGAEDQLKKYLPEIWIDAKKKQKKLAKIPSSIMVHTILPALFILFWICLSIMKK